jgi:hypothetical protein
MFIRNGEATRHIKRAVDHIAKADEIKARLEMVTTFNMEGVKNNSEPGE